MRLNLQSKDKIGSRLYHESAVLEIVHGAQGRGDSAFDCNKAERERLSLKLGADNIPLKEPLEYEYEEWRRKSTAGVPER